MKFLDGLIWILIIYAVYYSVVILHDYLKKMGVKEVTGVQEITVIKPAENPLLVRSGENKIESPIPDFYPMPPMPVSRMDFDGSDESGQGSIEQKKK